MASLAEMIAAKKKAAEEASAAELKPTIVQNAGKVNPFAKLATPQTGASPSKALVAAPQSTEVVPSLPAEVEVPELSATSAAPSNTEDFNHPEMVETIPLEGVAALKEHIEAIEASFGAEKEQIIHATRATLLFLRENPQFVQLLAPADFGVMVQAMRECHGVAQTIVVEKKDTRSKKASNMAENQALLSEALGDLGL